MVLLLLPIAGCGEGGESTAQDVQDPAAAILIQEEDLPTGAERAGEIPEPCSPVPILEKHYAEVVETPLLRMEDSSVAEVVGALPSVGTAKRALAELQDRERMMCIRATIENFGPREGDGVNIGELEPIAAGEEGSMVHLLEVDSASKPINSTTVVSLRSDRCVATMLFVKQGGGPEAAFTEHLSGRAHERLADAHSLCR